MVSKKDFPAARDTHNLDAAATGLLHRMVIKAVLGYYEHSCANAGRSPYKRSALITVFVEEARENISAYFGATKSELVFTPGATHSLNWVAKGLDWKPGDVVLLTKADHHANILPWMNLRNLGVEIRFAECDCFGRIDLADFKAKIKGVKLSAFIAASNVTGAIQPIKELVHICKNAGAFSIIDAAQIAPHSVINFDSLGADFMAIAGHKLGAPKGIGILLVKEAIQNKLHPLIVGGGVIRDVQLDGYKLMDFPEGFESGTPSIEGIIGLNATVEWLCKIDLETFYSYEKKLEQQAIAKLKAIPEVSVFHPETPTTPTFAFSVDGISSNRLAVALDKRWNVQVRSGHMCAMLLVRDIMGFKDGLVRVSFGPWNEFNDILPLVEGISKLVNEH